MEKAKQEKKMPARSVKIKIGEADYDIKMPLKNGDAIDIAASKIRMTGGTFKDMPFSGFESQKAYMLTEAIATFEILIPELRKDLLVGSLADLDQLQSKTLMKAYETFYACLSEWNEFINDDIAEKE